jgi:D-alanine-D-alanine ligase
METIGIIYEISGNPYFIDGFEGYSNVSEYVYPSEINDICQALKENGYNFEVIDGVFDLLKREEQLKSECIIFFNKSIGFKGLERKTPVPVLAQLYQLPMIGSTAYSMTLARHKFHTNRLLRGLGFLVPKAWVLYNPLDKSSEIEKFPVIVKPNAESDSLGIDENSVCYNLDDAVAKAKQIIELFGAPVIVEEFIPGAEIKVAVIGNADDTDVAGAVYILKKGEWLPGTFQTRADVLSDYLSYTPVSEKTVFGAVTKLAKEIHRLLELNDYSRIDFRIGADNLVYCMEVSTHPYIANTNAAFTSAAAQRYDSYSAMIGAILKAARKRLKC